MPFYDLRCTICDKEFNIMASMSDKTNRLIPCPECGSTDMETVYKSAPFYIKSGQPPAQTCQNSHACGAA
ncbi:MAG: zinc ribbon domain-containing protein [Oscillospiraceae bacterium]|jgi:putative FmdB family regulatory protein|nr:zinc ribbon domain-containing protein [Oscillospiraceae bacterium]